jgi:hypothetical protein
MLIAQLIRQIGARQHEYKGLVIEQQNPLQSNKIAAERQ